MITKSPAFNAAINANTRMTDFAAQFTFVPPGAVEGAAVTTSSAASYSDASQVKNGVTQMSADWRNFGDWVLDGNNSIIGSGEFGFWSASLSASDNSVSSCSVTYTMDAGYDLIGLTIAFDTLMDEYATEFTVEYYDSNNSLITSTTISDNTDALAEVSLTGTGVAKVVVTITEWCLPNARPRVAEILPGLIYVFDLDNSYSLQANNIIKPFSNSFEVGELSVTFDNSDHKFDFLNPVGVFSYLRQQMEVKSQIGLNINGVYDYTNSGDRYLWEIPSDEQVQTAALVCRPGVAFSSDDSAASVGSGDIATAAAALWAATGYPQSITVDASLQSIACNRYIGENVNINDALAALAITAGGYWKVNRDGSMDLLPISTSLLNPVYTLDYDEMLEKPKIKQNPLVTAVRIGYSYSDFNGDLRSKQTIYTNGTNNGSQIEVISFFTPTTTRAEALGQLALDYHAARRLSFDISYRGNPALEVGDVISVQTDYGYRNIEITEHTLTLDGNGFLRGNIKGVG